MEYLSNRPESTAFSHFIPLFFLFFVLLRSFGIHANIRKELRYQPETRTFVLADLTNFNEKNWWIDRSKQNERLICSQRTGVFSEFYEQANIVCTLGRQLSTAERSAIDVDKNADCITDGTTILCQHPDGTVIKYEMSHEEKWKKPRVKRVHKKL